jgi:peroxiredoxin Q/BCP
MEWWSIGVMGRHIDRFDHYSVTPIFHHSKFIRGGFSMAIPSVGQKAPEFTLPVSREQNVSLKDYEGKKNVVLAFYPLDFTGG